MSYLQAISDALESQRYRGLSGGDKGIARAIASREEPRSEDWEWLSKISSAALQWEVEVHQETIEADQKHQRWVERLSRQSAVRLRKRLTELSGQGTGPEVLDSGVRSTSKATRNEGARMAFGEIRAIKDALQAQESAKGVRP